MKLANNFKDIAPLNRSIKTPHYLLNRKRSLSKNVASPTFSLPGDVKKALTEVKQHQEIQKTAITYRKTSVSTCKIINKTVKQRHLTLKSKDTPWRDKKLGRKERLQLWLSSGPRSIDKKQHVSRPKPKVTSHTITPSTKPSKKKLNFLNSKFEVTGDHATFHDITADDVAPHNITTDDGNLLEQSLFVRSFSFENKEKLSPGRKVHFEDFSPMNFEASRINLCIMESSAFKRRIKGHSCNKVVTPVRRSIRLSTTSIPNNLRTDEKILRSPSEVKEHLLENKIVFMPNKNLRTPLNKIWNEDEHNLNLSFLS